MLGLTYMVLVRLQIMLQSKSVSVGGSISAGNPDSVLQPNGGSLGIGVTSPKAILDVSGTASISGTLTMGNGTTNAIQSAYGPLTLNYKSGLNAWSSGITLQDTTGNVGIGVTNPTSGYKLDVNGSILAISLYDKDNTSYYVNPAGDSVLGGGISMGGDIAMLGGAPTITTNNGGVYI